MKGLMMDFQLTLPTILKRAETYFPNQEIVTRMPDRSFHRYSFADFGKRARQLSVALKGLGLEPGDRVATLCWNHYQHLEAYLGIPCGGFVLHTLNLRLHPNDLGYIATHAGDKAVIVDKSLLPLWEQFKDKTQIEHVLVVEDSYEELLAGASADDYEDPVLDEDTAAAMCYTSGTTGMPKGVLYSHRSAVLHTLGQALVAPLGLHVTEAETMLPVVPMFHANAWGYPYTCLMVGAKLVFPGPFLDPETLLDDFEQEGVTITAGRADDLDGHPRHARQGARPLEPREAAVHARRRLGRAAGDDRRLPAAARQDRRARLGDDGDLAARDRLRLHRRVPQRRRGDAARRRRDAGPADPVRRAARDRRRRQGDPLGRRGDGRARGARALGRRRLLRDAGAGRALDRRRLVQDRRHRVLPSQRLRDDQGPLEGRDQVRRRVDLVRRPRERADGASRDRRGGGDRDPAREVGRAAAGGLRAPRGADARRRTS